MAQPGFFQHVVSWQRILHRVWAQWRYENDRPRYRPELLAPTRAGEPTAVDLEPEPTTVATQLNLALHRAGGSRAFMALFYGLLEPQSGRLEFLCAGQPFPLLLRDGGEVEELGEGALPLGMREAIGASPATVTLDPGDCLVLFTDGLAEAVAGPEQEAFGFDRIGDLTALGGGAREIHDRILAAFDQHLDGQPPGDDLTLVVLGRKG